MTATWADPVATLATPTTSWTGTTIVIPDINATSTPTVAGYATSTLTAPASPKPMWEDVSHERHRRSS